MSTFSTEIDVRFRDIDAMGHVNNAVYGTYVEQARVRYTEEVLDRNLAEMPTVLASLSIDFHRPVTLDDGTVTVEVDVPDLGTSSVPMTYDLRASDEVVAEGESTQVVVDPASGESRPIPEDVRERIASYHDL